MGRLKPYCDAKNDIIVAAAAQVKEAASVRQRCLASKFEVKFIAAFKSTMGAKTAGKRYTRLTSLNNTWTADEGNVDNLHPAIWAEHSKVIEEASR
jgi:hypothetical protein